MVVSYARPFSKNARIGGNATPTLPSNFLSLLGNDEREVHDIALQDRNTLLAHSDSSAWNLRTGFVIRADRRILLPVHNATNAPLVSQTVRTLSDICEKFMDHILEQRKQLENDFALHLPVVDFEDREDEEETTK